MLVNDLQPADGPSVRAKVCSDLRAGSAEVTAKIASSQQHALEQQVQQTTHIGRRLASRVHKEQMVQQMPSRATAACSLVVDASQVCAQAYSNHPFQSHLLTQVC